MEKTWLILVISMLLGLLYPNFSFFLEPYLMILLIIMITFSLKDIVLNKIINIKNLKKSFVLFLFNYIILTSLLILLAFLFVKDSDYKKGFVIMAAVPCAIVVIPFTKLLKADTNISTLGLITTYFLSLFLTPLIIWLFFKESINFFDLLKTLFLLVILPLFLSRLLNIFNGSLKKYDTIIINLIFLITTYGFIALNRETIVNNFFSLKSVIFVLFIKTFILTAFLYFILKKLKTQRKTAIPIILFTNYKNLGYAALLSLTLINKEAALPSTLGILFDSFLFIYLEKILKY